jgi:hypothetical protein
MTATYTVQQGDCIESIADRHGHFWEALWDHPSNAELKRKRGDPNVLQTGDVVHVPPLRRVPVQLATSNVHRFRRKGVPSRLELRFLDEDEPIANRSYQVDVDGKITHGHTDGDGQLSIPISPRARMAIVTLEGETPEQFSLGHVDPVDTPEGIAQRLHNLGYDCAANENSSGVLEAAIRELQADNDLTVTGEVDDDTRAILKDLHGC